jgi:hypothetical protein
MKKTIIIASAAILVLLGVVYISMSISATNREASLRNSIEAKIKDNKSNYTKMFEILVEQAGVSAQYAEDFKEIYPSLVEGRYNHGGGQMMQWIQEHNPTFDTSLYKQVMTSIEAQRESFHSTQQQLTDLSRQHNNLLTMFPTSWFLSDVEKIEIPIVINNAAEKAFSSGKEDSMNLFPRHKKDSTSKSDSK